MGFVNAIASWFTLGANVPQLSFKNWGQEVEDKVSARRSGQVVFASTGALATGTTLIPDDDTIPQNTEGDQFLTATITPTDAASNLLVEAGVYGSASGAARALAALFRDSGADAIAASKSNFSINTCSGPLIVKAYVAAGSTAATTFKLRAGGVVAGTFTLNGQLGARVGGGVLVSWISITEVLPT